MLNKAKLFKQFETLSDKIFFDISNELKIALEAWKIISADSEFKSKIKDINSPWLLPNWQDDLSLKKEIKLQNLDYKILGVDGSQVYPDRHQGTTCFLINTGAVKLEYGQNSKANLMSEPHVFVDNDLDELSINDYVDCLREEFEFKLGLDLTENNLTDLLIFDGSLIFWHLMAKDNKLKNHFLKKYLEVFFNLYQKQILYCSYVSLPNNKELINLIRMQLCNFEPDQYLTKFVDKISDANLMFALLKEGQRSIIFENQAQIVKEYPSELRPHFFYFNVGQEIARIEIPAWIANDKSKVELIEQIILDQCVKGSGYPVVLAEAHEQAVVKSADRQFFYELLAKTGLNKNFSINGSLKAAKKRRMNF